MNGPRGFLLLVASLVASVSSGASAAGSPAPMRYATGVLVSWSTTETRPQFTIRGATGPMTFAASRGLTIDGKPVICDPQSPTRHYTIVGCRDFPGNVHIGRTRVRVGYVMSAARPLAQTVNSLRG